MRVSSAASSGVPSGVSLGVSSGGTLENWTRRKIMVEIVGIIMGANHRAVLIGVVCLSLGASGAKKIQ